MKGWIKLNKKKLLHFVPAIVFLVFIYVMCLLFIFQPKEDYSASEKRYLADFPDASFENIVFGDFDSEFESYMADHVAGRSFYVGLNAYYELSSGRNGSNGVYACADNYLINDPVDRNTNIESNLGVFSQFTEANSLNTSLMIIPSTGYVMSDKLPANHKDYLDGEYFDLIEENCGSMNFINVENAFKSAAGNGDQLYYRTDHHWTTRGAYLAYTEYCRALELEATPEESYDKTTVSGFYGTTYSTSGFWNTPPDNIEFWENRDNIGAVNVKITEGTETEEYDSYFFLSHLEEDDKYPTFLDGNHALVEITNENAQGGAILVIKDSYAHAMMPFLSENYSKIIMVDLRYYKAPISALLDTDGDGENDITDCLVLYSMENFATDTDIPFLS